MNRKRIIPALLVLILATLACNIYSATLPAPTPTTQTPIDTLTPTVTFTPTRTVTAAIPVSGGQILPQITVNVSTNCRTGPGAGYAFVMAFNPGQTARVIGKYPATNYWIINTSNGGSCWLWGQYATITGDINNIPLFDSPGLPTTQPTSTTDASFALQPTLTYTSISDTFTPAEALPIAPANLTQSHTCDSGFSDQTPIWIESVTLIWQDNTANETGYRIFHNNSPLPADLPADSSQTHITLSYNKGNSNVLFDTFGVAAFNNSGISAIALADVPRCP